MSSLAFALFACGDDDAANPVLAIDNAATSQSFTAAGGIKTVDVTANGQFSATVENNKTWCYVPEITATSFNISVAANTGIEACTAKVTVSLNGAPSIDVIVTQEAVGIPEPPAPTLSVSPQTVNFNSHEADSRTVTVTTNQSAYTATVENGKTWLTTAIQ
jgi:hypothetical protein